jgi:hypothetical protein
VGGVVGLEGVLLAAPRVGGPLALREDRRDHLKNEADEEQHEAEIEHPRIITLDARQWALLPRAVANRYA